MWARLVCVLFLWVLGLFRFSALYFQLNRESKMDALGSLIRSFQIDNLGITQGFNLSCRDVFSLVDR